MTERETSGGTPERGGVVGYLDSRVEGMIQDFNDPRFEGRRLFSELLGTFFLVLVAAGGAVVNAQSGGQIPLAVRVTAPGLMVMAMILFMGAVSGAHFNPVVSVGFALRGDFPWKRVPGYVIAQLVGSILAVVFLRATLGNIGGLGTTEPGPDISATTALVFEAVLTLGLLSTILGTASGARIRRFPAWAWWVPRLAADPPQRQAWRRPVGFRSPSGGTRRRSCRAIRRAPG